ncbi:CopG family transcriptional regulator [Mycolicibacterium brumae]|uniref:ribbon-helix-helix domain-containing protein n=1 Tax=Mycolicibacterium brumae TaxID=85968 RepID=UPI000AE48FBC|nr:CopG family transcriptional regulator [Mycolicibacterium brumae]MCV7194212.1 hypothetical protein [Mycolicibacterium brumae]UWW08379.1 ribbon-helix-helix domain-containing protein [Mycolicibacterium brumae]
MTGRTDDDYAAMAADFEAGDFEIVGPASVGPGAFVKLKEGRPAGRREAGGSTPTMSVRFPSDLREGIAQRAAAESIKPAELVRRAVAEYLMRHPA